MTATYTIPIFAQNRTLERSRNASRGVGVVDREIRSCPRGLNRRSLNTTRTWPPRFKLSFRPLNCHVLRHFKTPDGAKESMPGGGVALNCSANGVIRRSDLFQPRLCATGCRGRWTALGAALYVQRLHDPGFQTRKMSVPLWGPEFGDEQISNVLNRSPARRSRVVQKSSFAEVCQEVAQRISKGEIVGWFQGRMEFGPRALGSRSILADPRDAGMREKINALVKKREGFRPFAPVVTGKKRPKSLKFLAGMRTGIRTCFMSHMCVRSFGDKLPATTHVDGSARVQTVSAEQNPKLWQLLREFEGLSGMPVLLNTSFNVRGQPIVCTPEEAIDTFLAAKLDLLVLGKHPLDSYPYGNQRGFETACAARSTRGSCHQA